MHKRKYIGASWKMNMTADAARRYFDELLPLIEGSEDYLQICVPFTIVGVCAKACEGSNLYIGAQNLYPEDSGAFTGEVSGPQLKDVGAKVVMMGHSERRALFNESDAFVNRKVKAALNAGLAPVLCIGEPLDIFEMGAASDFLGVQIKAALRGLSEREALQVTVAHEPIWAIGTGLSSSPEIAAKSIMGIRESIASIYDEAVAERMRVVYGGSVQPGASRELMAMDGIDGVLVGKASLDPVSYSRIINER